MAHGLIVRRELLTEMIKTLTNQVAMMTEIAARGPISCGMDLKQILIFLYGLSAPQLQ